MRKLVCIALGLILSALILFGWLAFAGRKPLSAAWVSLPDGTSVRILGTTYGTNHLFGTPLARVIARLPMRLQDVAQGLLGPRFVPAQMTSTPTPQFLVWLERSPSGGAPGTGYFEALLSNGSNFISGEDVFLQPAPFAAQIQPVRFTVFPRRDPEINLVLFFHDQAGIRLCAAIRFANPFHRNYPQWKPEPLPAVRNAGDLQVTLRKLETGHNDSQNTQFNRDGSHATTYGTNITDGRNYTVIENVLRPLANTNDVWQIAGVEISDATGNCSANTSMSWGSDTGSLGFMPSLWPEESAWKVKLLIKRTAGFKPEELFSFRKVPLGQLGQTNLVGWTTNVEGISITLQSICWRAPFNNTSWSSSQLSSVKFTHATLPACTQLDLLEMVCDSGKTNHSESWSSSSNERSYSFREIPTNSQTADFFFAIQTSRTVEFTVKPRLPGANP